MGLATKISSGLAAAQNVSGGANLFVNPGAESGMSSWISTSAGPGFISTDADHRSGSHCFAESPALASITSTGIGMYQEFPVTPGQNYRMALYYKATASNTVEIILFAGFYDSSGTPISFLTVFDSGISIPTSWTQGSGSVAVPANAATAKFFVQATRTTNAGFPLIDDLELTLMPAVAAPLTEFNGALTVALQGISNAYLGLQAVQANSMAVAAITYANAAIDANAIVDSNVLNVGVTKLIAGTRIFTGDVIFSRGTSSPVMVLNTSGLYMFGVADASTGGTGLVTQPYVVANNSGVLVASGTGGPSAFITPSGLTLYSVHGSLTNPYFTVGSTQIRSHYGLFEINIASAQITMSYNTSAILMTLDASKLKFQNGTYYTQITSSQVKMDDGAGTTLVLGSSQLAFTAGTYSLVVQASQVIMFNGSQSLTLDASKVQLVAGTNSLTATATTLSLSTGSVSLTMTSTTFLFTTGGASGISMDSSGVVTVTNTSGYGSSINGNIIGTGSIASAEFLLVGPGFFTWPSPQSHGSAGSSAGYLDIKVGATMYKLQYFNP